MPNHARAHPHQASRIVGWRQLALQTGMYQAVRVSLHNAAETEEAVAKLAVRLDISTDEARLRLDRARRDRGLRVQDAYRLVLHSERSPAEPLGDWAERELQRPKSSAQYRTVRVMGKPYHWRQDYTGQLKLAAGESPW